MGGFWSRPEPESTEIIETASTDGSDRPPAEEFVQPCSSSGVSSSSSSTQDLELTGRLESHTNLSQSFELLPPSMSELRVLLLGNNWSENCSVGNFILGETKFSTEKEPRLCQKESGQIKGKDIVLLNTPDREFLPLSLLKMHTDPGLHVILLVLQPDDFSEEQKLRLCGVLDRLSDRSYHHSLILISTPRDESPGPLGKYRQRSPLKDLIRKCQYRYLWCKDLELQEVLTRFNEIMRENNGEYLDIDE